LSSVAIATGLGVILVRSTVAVVVEPVTGLDGGQSGITTTLHVESIVRAGHLSRQLALAGPDGARLSQVKGLVDSTVAVIVQGVASLTHGISG